MSPLETPLDIGIVLHSKVDNKGNVYSLYPTTRDIDVALTTLTDDGAITLDDKIAIYDTKHTNIENRLTVLEDAGTSYVYGELTGMIAHDESISITNDETTKVSTFSVVSSPKLTTSRTFTIGNCGKSFNGTESVSWTLSEIGAASSDHTHSYAEDLTPLTVEECESIVNRN